MASGHTRRLRRHRPGQGRGPLPIRATGWRGGRRRARPTAVQAAPFPSPSAQAEGQVAEPWARHRTTPDTRPFAGAKGGDRARAPPPPDATAHSRASAARDAHRRPDDAPLRRGRLLDLEVAGRSPDAFRRAVLGGRRGHDVMEHLGRRREREERSLDRAHRRFLRRRLGRRTGLVESAGEPERAAVAVVSAPKRPREPEIVPPPADPADAAAPDGEMPRHPNAAGIEARLAGVTGLQREALMDVIMDEGSIPEQPRQAACARYVIRRRW
jgi:hypothetical protein